MLPTRRRLLQAAIMAPALPSLHAARKEFWDSKDPSAWSSEEKEILLYRSPWAREGAAKFEVERKRARGAHPTVSRPGGDVPGARPGVTPGMGNSVPIGEAPPRPPNPETGPPVEFRVLARWVSARPVRLAGGPQLPEEIAGFYVVMLRGMPLLPPRKGADGQPEPNPNQAMLAEIKQNTRIERKDKPPVRCERLLTGSGDSVNDLLLFFPRGADPIAAKEKTVELASRFGPFELSVKFQLKEMMYRGELAL